MYRYLWLLLLPTIALGQISTYTESTNPDANDLFYLLGSPSGTPVNRKLKIRTIQENVDVKSFGAKGDANTDDATAFQNAINYALLNKRGVFVPAGEYCIGTTLTIGTGAKEYTGFQMIGQGRPQIVWDGATGGQLMKITSVSFSEFSGIYFDGNDVADSNGIWITTASTYPTMELLWRCCDIRDFGKIGLDVKQREADLVTCDWMEFSECHIGYNNINVVLRGGVRDCHFVGGANLSADTYGVRIDGGKLKAVNVTFAGNTTCDIYLNGAISAFNLFDCCSESQCIVQTNPAVVAGSSLIGPSIISGFHQDLATVTPDPLVPAAIDYDIAQGLVLVACRFANNVSIGSDVTSVTATEVFFYPDATKKFTGDVSQLTAKFSGGKEGRGTTDPAELLHLKDETGSPLLLDTTADGVVLKMKAGVLTDSQAIGRSADATDMREPNGTAQIILHHGNGYVSIGDTGCYPPQAQLHVGGGAMFEGHIYVRNGATSGGYIDLYEDSDETNDNYVRLLAPALAADLSFTLPAADGTSGQFLKTNGSGVLSFGTAAGGGDMLAATYDADADGDIDVAAGGTEKSTWTQYAIPYLSNTTVFGEVAIGTAGQMLKVNSGATGYDWLSANAGTNITADLEEETHAAEHAVAAADTVFPADPGADRYLMWDDDPGALAWAEVSAGYTNLTSFVAQTAWRVLYSNADGDITELALGSDGEYLKSNGASAAPTWATPSGAAHDAASLAADADAILGLSTQEINLDTQTANYVFSGPVSGAAADPTFRALVADDIPDLSGTYLTAEVDGSASNELPTAGFAIDVSTTEVAFDSTEITGATTWDDGGEASVAWTWNLSAGDPTLTMGNDLFTLSNSLTVVTGKNITLGTTQWNSSDAIDGEQIAADTIDDDSIDFTDVTLADITDDVGYLTAEVDGSTTNEIEVVDEAFNATNFNGGTTAAVSQDDFYDLWHGIDTDDDGDVDAMDATVWATKQAADADLTTYAGITPSADMQTFLAYANLAAIKAGISLDDLVTLSGVADGAVNLGEFTGTTITDNVTLKAAMQLLETAVETKQATVTEGSLANSVILSADIKDGEVAVADLATDAKTFGINFVIDGGGSAITTGIKGDIELPFAGTITSVRLLADQSGSIVVDIWEDTYANFPPTNDDTSTASTPPTITTATKSEDSTLTSWDTTFSAGDTLRINVDSCTTITRCTLSIRGTKS